MFVCPFRHCQVRVGPHPSAPGAQDILGAVKGEIEARGQIRCVLLIIQARP